MAIDRRQFLRLAAGALTLQPLRLIATPATGALSARRWLSCRADLAGRYYFTILDVAGRILHDVPLPARGHGMAVRPGSNECVVLARRPGTFLLVVDGESGRLVRRVETPADRHYYGHGVFDPEGRLLYATENAFEQGRGVIGVYDSADGYRRVGELPSHGVGPHELRFRSDGQTLVVANGGIRTHPDLGRAKLGLPEMAPNLAYIEASSGQLLDAFAPPTSLRQLSIRHLDITPDDKVCIGMQWQGPAKLAPPLVAVHQGEEQLRLRQAPEPIQQAMRNYCGSVRCDGSGEWFAVSAPRGNLITFWSTASGRCLGRATVEDGCGVAPDTATGRFTVSSGQGDLFTCLAGLESTETLPVRHSFQIRWDNHLATLRVTPRSPEQKGG